ncbi:TnpV protein [Halorhodospira sp. 9622]|uniref:TnpV protein n=1 Tax=Halorhodospira sp. 9622 TaxID=2899136 RepID=UPI00351D254D
MRTPTSRPSRTFRRCSATSRPPGRICVRSSARYSIISGRESSLTSCALRGICKRGRAMEIKMPYLRAMQERAPQIYRELMRSGTMEEHLSEVSKQAHAMYRELTANAPKYPDGVVKEPHHREAEEIVRETFIDFESDPDEIHRTLP